LDEFQNPYRPGAGTEPPALLGRDALLKRFEVMIARLGDVRPDKSVMQDLQGPFPRYRAEATRWLGRDAGRTERAASCTVRGDGCSRIRPTVEEVTRQAVTDLLGRRPLHCGAEGGSRKLISQMREEDS